MAMLDWDFPKAPTENAPTCAAVTVSASSIVRGPGASPYPVRTVLAQADNESTEEFILGKHLAGYWEGQSIPYHTSYTAPGMYSLDGDIAALRLHISVKYSNMGVGTLC